MKGGKLLGRGASKCTISEPICGDSPDEVTSVLYRLDNKSLADFSHETDLRLLSALAKIDTGQRYLFASSLSQKCNPNLRIHDLPAETQDDLKHCLGPSFNPDQLVSTINFFQVARASKTFSEEDIVPQKYVEYFKTSVDILHKNGIVHGDLHRRNLGIRKDFPIIFDFGMARFKTDMTDTEWAYAVQKDNSMLERALKQPDETVARPLTLKERIALLEASRKN